MLTGNDPGASNTPLLITGTILILGGAIMNANIIGTIANVFQQMNIKEMKLQELLDVANIHMYNLKLESTLHETIRHHMLHSVNSEQNNKEMNNFIMMLTP